MKKKEHKSLKKEGNGSRREHAREGLPQEGRVRENKVENRSRNGGGAREDRTGEIRAEESSVEIETRCHPPEKCWK